MSPEALTYERGRFYVGPNGFPRFAGSATGVYLADTVRTQVSPAEHPSNNQDIDDAFMNRNNDLEPRKDEVSSYSHFTLRASDLKPHTKIRQCIENYFRLWHPLFPFLDGAYVIDSFDNAVALAQLDEAVSMSFAPETSTAPQARANRPAFDGLKEEEGLILSAIIKAVVSIGAMGLSQEEKLGLPLLFSTTQVTMLGHFIVGASENSSVSDLLAIQALLGIELYLYLSRLMRPAMHLSGVLAKLAFEAGLHRCPERYTSTFTLPADRQLRKRVFYSLYVLDRILTAEFGVPIMLHDSDVDTCVPGGIERHTGGDSTPDHPARTPTDSLRESATSGRTPKRRRIEGDPSGGQSIESVTAQLPVQVDSGAEERRLLTLYSLVGVARLGGRAMEVFNKSIHHRALSTEETLRLRTDLESWWNGMTLEPEDDEEDVPPDPRSRYSTLFTCLYHQHIMSLCRPALSLSPARMEHAHALQTAVTSARAICNLLYRELSSTKRFELFWPGYVDMVFFAALILVHGSNRQRYQEGGELNRSKTALNRAGKILERLSDRWSNLGSFKRIIHTLTASSPAHPADQTPSLDPGNISGARSMGVPFTGETNWTSGLNEGAVESLFTTDFSFDFESFGINPDSLWAFHTSIPGSPNFA